MQIFMVKSLMLECGQVVALGEKRHDEVIEVDAKRSCI